ncbi:MAG: glycosyltransferase [Bacteroidetes bacterium]|nr:glycosyltransferase [Bacteroidota bacterium]
MQLDVPVIQIVTPFYNTGAVFRETVACVKAVRYPRWEWLIVNDGSQEEGSLSMLDELRRDADPRIRIVDIPSNLGLPAARNKGIELATAEFIFFLDADDLIEPDYLEKAWLALELNPAFAFVNSWSSGFGAKNYEWKVGLEKGLGFLDENWVAFCGLFRRDFLVKNPFNESRRGGLEDWEFWLSAAAKGYWGYTIPEIMFHYRIQAVSGKWENWDHGERQKATKKSLQKLYGARLRKHFPKPQKAVYDEKTGMPTLPNGRGRAGGEREAGAGGKPLLLVVLPWLAPGGVEQFTLAWMRALRPVFDFVIVTTNTSLRNDDAGFGALSDSIFHLGHLADASLYPVLLRYILESRPPDGVVLSHSEPFYHLLPYVRHRYPRLPIIDINHIEDMGWQGGGFPKIAAEFTSLIDRHVVISQWLGEFMKKQGVRADKLRTLYINTDTEAILPLDGGQKERLRQQLGVPADKPVLVFVGRLTHQKNVLLLPDIAASLVGKGQDFILVVCGDGPDRAQLEEKIYRQGLTDHFQLIRSVPHARALDYIRCADLMVLPSAWEGIATVLYEAMAAGLPIVATDVGGQRELVTGDCGILISLSEKLVEDTAEAVSGLLRDPERRLQMGMAGRMRVEEFFDQHSTWAELRDILEDALAAVTGGNTSGEEEAIILQRYSLFARRWIILQAEKRKHPWKSRREIILLHRIFKVLTRKRPISHIWRKGQNTGY